uniref:FF domain-containing protein n=1 Tax=Caenorhabditis tropicalis TaxID=1561998 RepID=A0A1I7TN46_9PELO
MLSDLQHTLRMTAEWRRKVNTLYFLMVTDDYFQFKELRREMEYYMRLEDKKERRAIRKVKEAAARRGRNNL